VGKHVRYQSPRNLERALQIALAVQEAEKQERFNDCFFTTFENSVRLVSRSSGQTYREDGKSLHSAKHAVMCVVSAVKLGVAMASQRPQEIGMHRPEPH